jgi:bifunctional DNase/RNase
MIEMQVSHVGTGSQYNRVRLIDKEEHIIFPFFVGSSDARAITMALAGEFDDRPSTHDLMLAIFARYAITVRRVVISDLIRGCINELIHFGENVNLRNINRIEAR